MKGIPNKLQPWFDARRRFRLSHRHIQMARELGMNPSKFGSLANDRQEPWKLPLPEFIEECYRKRFGRSEPEQVLSLELLVKAKAAKRQRNAQAKQGDSTAKQVEGTGRTD